MKKVKITRTDRQVEMSGIAAVLLIASCVLLICFLLLGMGYGVYELIKLLA